MGKQPAKSLRLSLEWAAVLGATIALIAGKGILAKSAVVVLCVVGAIGLILAFYEHGWLRAPIPIGTTLRVPLLISIAVASMTFIGWYVWPEESPAERAIISTSKTLVTENDYKFDVTIRVHYVGSRQIQAHETYAFLWNDKEVQPSIAPAQLGFAPGDTEELNSSVRIGPSDRAAFDAETGKLVALLTIEYPTDNGTITRYTFEGRVHPKWNQLDVIRNEWTAVSRQP
jgi:hypothetical protein